MIKPGTIPKSCKWIPEKGLYSCTEKGGTTFRDASGFTISKESLELKEKGISKMIDVSKKCVDSGKCKKDIYLSLYVLDTCPACAAHKPILTSIVNRLKESNIPISIDTVPARDSLDEFTRVGCNGTPCVVLEGRRPKKLYEGNLAETNALSQILGLPNPLFKEIKDGAVPKRLK